MFRSLIVTLRTLAIFAFLLAMPLLAFPPVARRVEAALADLRPRLSQWLVAFASPRPPESGKIPVDPTPVPPPPPPPPSFMQEPPPGEKNRSRQDGSTDARAVVEDATLRLEQWGAREIALQPTGDGGYRFSCQIPLSNSLYSKPFSATGQMRDAVGQVVADVEAWRTPRDARGGASFPAPNRPQGLP